MRRAICALPIAPQQVLVDGKHLPSGLTCAAQALIKGDALVPAISAASILAKTVRDAELLELDRLYPQYGFAQHKGYPTAAHRQALRIYGACPAHRRSFAPVAATLRGNG